MDVLVFKADQPELNDIARIYREGRGFFTSKESVALKRDVLEMTQIQKHLEKIIGKEDPDIDCANGGAFDLAGAILCAEFDCLSATTNDQTIGTELHFAPESFHSDENGDPSRPFWSFRARLVRKRSGWYLFDLERTDASNGQPLQIELFYTEEMAEDDEPSLGDLTEKYSGKLDC